MVSAAFATGLKRCGRGDGDREVGQMSSNTRLWPDDTTQLYHVAGKYDKNQRELKNLHTSNALSFHCGYHDLWVILLLSSLVVCCSVRNADYAREATGERVSGCGELGREG